MLPYLIMKEGVEQYVLNGANLMWPGVRDVGELGQYRQGEVVGLATSAGIVVGVASMADRHKPQPIETRTGIACYLLHSICDKLVAGPDAVRFLEKPIMMARKQEETK